MHQSVCARAFASSPSHDTRSPSIESEHCFACSSWSLPPDGALCGSVGDETLSQHLYGRTVRHGFPGLAPAESAIPKKDQIAGYTSRCSVGAAKGARRRTALGNDDPPCILLVKWQVLKRVLEPLSAAVDPDL